jgi:hypothetical protein
MSEKILLGYTGSWAFGVKSFYQIERLKEKLKRNPNDKKARGEIAKLEKKREGTPVYISREKYKKLLEWREMKHYSNFL